MAQSVAPRRIEGACHCGNIRFVFFWPRAGGPIPVRVCGCSFCRKHGGVYTSHPEGRLEVTIAADEDLQRYRFGTETADFFVCRRCGVIPLVTSAVGECLYAVVNVNAFEGVDCAELDQSPTDFEGETVDGRLARRQRNWIPDVSFA